MAFDRRCGFGALAATPIGPNLVGPDIR